MSKRARGLVRWFISFLVAVASGLGFYFGLLYLGKLAGFLSTREIFPGDQPLNNFTSDLLVGVGIALTSIPLVGGVLAAFVAFFMCYYSDKFKDWCQ